MRLRFTRGLSSLSIALLATSPLVGATAAHAKEKASTPKFSQEYIKAGQPVETAVKAKDWAAAKAALPAMQAAAKTPFERYLAWHFALQTAAALNDEPGQREAVTQMLATGAVPADELPALHFFAGNFAYSSNDYARAATELKAALDAGYNKNNVQLLYLDSLLRGKQYDQAFDYARTQIAAQRAAHATVVDDWFARPAEAARLSGRKDVMLDFLTGRLENSPKPEYWQNALLLYLQNYDQDRNARIDALRLMAATNSMKSPREYLEYLALATELALPGEVVGAYEKGRANGVIQASDSQLSAIYNAAKAKTASDRASLADAARDARTAASSKVAKGAGDGYLSFGEYPKAIEMYQLALTKPDADKNLLNSRIGIAYALQRDAAQAKAAFAQTSGSRAALGRLWLLYAQQSATAPASS